MNPIKKTMDDNKAFLIYCFGFLVLLGIGCYIEQQHELAVAKMKHEQKMDSLREVRYNRTMDNIDTLKINRSKINSFN